MSAPTFQGTVLLALARRPSRSSAATIGHEFVLNGVPPALQIRGLNALADMTCDWTVAILEEAINSPTRTCFVRHYALSLLGALLQRAIDQGYRRIGRDECRQLLRAAGAELGARCAAASSDEIAPVEELCNHLSEAVAEGCFEELPDF